MQSQQAPPPLQEVVIPFVPKSASIENLNESQGGTEIGRHTIVASGCEKEESFSSIDGNNPADRLKIGIMNSSGKAIIDPVSR